MNRMLGVALGLGVLAAGCQQSEKRLNAPPHGVPEETADLQGTFVYMHDNALLADMTVSDYHFMPHRAGLTTLGKQRLDRLASLIEAYGGDIRFNTDLADEALVRSRTDAIVAYLGELGVDTRTHPIQRAMPGGAGMTATEAVLIKLKEGTYDPEKKKAAASGGDSTSLGS
jgi:hypothetical protein